MNYSKNTKPNTTPGLSKKHPRPAKSFPTKKSNIFVPKPSEINSQLTEVPGSIASLESSINVGISGINVQLVVTVDERKIQKKKLIWVNQGGSNEEEALSRAREKLNKKISNITGEIADFHLKFISPPLPQRTYVTMIAGVNEKVPENVGKLSTEERRARLTEIMSLLGNNASGINISKTAEIFDVSRDIIYRDLKKLGLER